MKVVLLTSDYLPNIGGIAAHVAGLAKALVQLGHDVTVVVPQPQPDAIFLTVSSENTHGWVTSRLRAPNPRWLGRWRYAPSIARWLKREIGVRPGVVHWHTFEHRIIERLTEASCIFTNHSSHFLEFAADEARHNLAHRILAPARFVIAPSRELAVATQRMGKSPANVRYIPNGVDCNRFTPLIDGRPVRQRHGITDRECVFLCPRRLEKKNGVIYWINAIRQMTADYRAAARFLFVGDYPQADSYSARDEVLAGLRELQPSARVIFTGAVAPADMPAYMAAADVVVLPSLVEATSIAGLEAMASGKPIVGTTVGGIPEIVTPGVTGVLVAPRDEKALAEAAAQLASAPELRRAMGGAARERAAGEFDWSLIADRTVAVYEEAMQSAK